MNIYQASVILETLKILYYPSDKDAPRTVYQATLMLKRLESEAQYTLRKRLESDMTIPSSNLKSL